MKKIIFDLDGTLLFLSNTWETVYQDFIDTYNLNTTPKELFQTIGTFEKDNNNIIVTKEILCDYINSKININMTVDLLNDLDNRYNDIPLIDAEKIYNILEKLSNKYELIAYTNWFTIDQTYRLRKYDLEKFFTKIYGWDIVKLKPSKEGLESIIEDNKEDYIMIGDTILTDMEIADSIGVKTLFYNRKKIIQDKYNEFSEIDELLNML